MVDNDVVKVESSKSYGNAWMEVFHTFWWMLAHANNTFIKDIQVGFFIKTITKSTINWDWLNHANNVQLSSVLGSL